MKQVKRVIQILCERYPQKGAVDLGDPRDTLIATILSARTRDDQVLKIYPAFKKCFPTWEKLARAPLPNIEKAVRSVNYYRTKARTLKKLAQIVISDFHGHVPDNMDDLLTLPGVGRKTASCVLSYEFSKPAIAVDTHVYRISRRLGWSVSLKRDDVERDLMRLVPKSFWNEINRTFIPFGRDVCKPQNPQCWRCPIAAYCGFRDKILK